MNLKNQFNNTANTRNSSDYIQKNIRAEACHIYFDTIIPQIKNLADNGKYQYVTQSMNDTIKSIVWKLAKEDGFFVKECGFWLRKLCINWQDTIDANWFPGE